MGEAYLIVLRLEEVDSDGDLVDSDGDLDRIGHEPHT